MLLKGESDGSGERSNSRSGASNYYGDEPASGPRPTENTVGKRKTQTAYHKLKRETEYSLRNAASGRRPTKTQLVNQKLNSLTTNPTENGIQPPENGLRLTAHEKPEYGKPANVLRPTENHPPKLRIIQPSVSPTGHKSFFNNKVTLLAIYLLDLHANFKSLQLD